MHITQIEEQINCNILLIGKSGAGKSSFANYLFGVDMFTTGVGHPITKQIQHFQFMISDIAVNIYDSVGLEPDNFNQWMKNLSFFLAKRQAVNYGHILHANKIIHTLFYCINGAGGGVEPNELKILKDICDRYKLPNAVIITHCDIARQEQIAAIEKEIKKHHLESFRVCSTSRKTRGGDKKEPFGKEAPIRKMLSDSYEKVGRELTHAVFQNIIRFLMKCKEDLKNRVDESDLSIISFVKDNANSNQIEYLLDNIATAFELSAGKFVEGETLMPAQFKSYHTFMEQFCVEYQGRNILNENLETIDNIVSNFSEIDIALLRKIEKAYQKIEDGNIIEKIDGIFILSKKLLFLKKTLKEVVDEAFDLIISSLDSLLRQI